MGCNVSPYRGGVPRLVETRALSTNIAAKNKLYDFFVADDRCIVNITNIEPTGGSAGQDGYVLNDGTVSDYFALSSVSTFNNFNAIKAQGRLIATVYTNGIVLLLEKGDRIRVFNGNATHTLTATAYIYK